MNDGTQFDLEHIWHPYTSMVDPLPVYEVESAQGVRIQLTDGTDLIDGMSSWWCAIHGYNHQRLNAIAIEQLKKMAHVMFGGLTHQPAIKLARKLLEITPRSMEHVFFADSGSVAVEVAIKMAIQYWSAQERPEKSRLLTVKGGYHGDTFAAMSVCDPVTGMHERFGPILAQQHFLPRPVTRFDQTLDPSDRDSLTEAFDQLSDSTAALILEPVVQGAGGMWFYSPEYLVLARELCDQHDVLLIFDEVATGFGRTGKLFAAEHAGIDPDIMALGKALTGGYLTLAATLTNVRVAHGLSADGGVLMHGPTFMANPLACSVALESVTMLLERNWQQDIRRIQDQLENEILPLASHDRVHDTRVLGSIGVVQTREPVNVAAMQRFFVNRGVWIRPFNDLIYLMPPYVINPDDLEQLTRAVQDVLDVC